MKINISFLTIIFIAVLFISCSDEEKTKENLESLTYKEIKIGKTLDGCDTTKDCTSIYFYYPEFNNESENPLIDSINNFIMGKLLFDDVEFDSSATLEKVIDYFIEDYKLQLKDFPEYSYPWYSKTKASVEYQDKNYLSLKISNESFSGGAHPNYFTNYFVINKNTGKEILLKELFKPNFEKELNEVVSKEFRKVRGIKSNNSLSEEGYWFEDTQNIFNDNFGISEKGILFYYNPYDVAPYSYGPTIVKIPYSEIESIINL